MRVWTLLASCILLALVMILVQGTARGVELDPTPIWQNGTLMGPARGAAELVKANFSYNSKTKKLLFRRDTKAVEMRLGSKSAEINGQTKALPEAPKVINGTSYVPLKNLLIGLGYEVKSGGENVWILCSGNLCIRLEVPPKPR